MTIETETTFSGPYSANGATTVFPFSFAALAAEEVVVVARAGDGSETTVSPADYGVTFAEPGPGGTVTIAIAPPSGLSLFIISQPAFTQEIGFEDESPWLPASINEANDRAALRDLWLKERADRALQLPRGETSPPLPSIAEFEGGNTLTALNGKWIAVVNNPAGAEAARIAAEAAAIRAEEAAAALCDGPCVDTLPQLATIPDANWSIGEFAQVRSIGTWYERVASGGHIVLDGGRIHANIMPKNGWVSLDDIGCVSEDVDPLFDNAPLIQTLLDNFNRVFVPPKVYRTKIIYIKSYQTIEGIWGKSTLKRFDGSVSNNAVPNTSMYILVSYAWAQGTPDPADNKRNMIIRGIRFDGRGSEFGYQPFSHNVVLSATDDAIVEYCEFLDFRGDGIYVASGTTGGQLRYNHRVRVRYCLFDGVTKNNRNGLSIIDCNVSEVHGCVFRRIGNSTLSASVGGIDYEPNSADNIYKSLRITACQFEDIDTTNTAGVTLFNSGQPQTNKVHALIEGCRFERCFWGAITASRTKETNETIDGLIIRGNWFLDGISFDVITGGYIGVTVESNMFEISDPAYRGGVLVGRSISFLCRVARGNRIKGNWFRNTRGQFGAICMISANGAIISENTFNDVNGDVMQFLPAATAGNGQIFKDIVIENNVVNNRGRYAGGPNTNCFIRFGLDINTGLNNSLISGTVVDRGNRINDGVPLRPGGTTCVLAEQTTGSAAPTTGTWQIGEFTRRATPIPNQTRYYCTVAGTFGTLTGVTVDTTAGSTVLTNLVDPASSLREGQVLSIGGNAYQVRAIIGTDVHVSTSANLTTATGVSLGWFAPSFATT